MTDQPRVLIIEDNDALRAMLFTILRHQPVAVDTAADSEDALRKVLSCDYAMVLIDLHLDDASTFLRDFADNRPETTSFVIAVRDPRQDVTIDSPLVAAVVDKPIEIDVLAEVVRECAALVPAPEDPLPCPPSESEVRIRLDRGPYYPN